MSKPKQKKSGSKSKKRIPARKVKPKCRECKAILHRYDEIDIGYCEHCLKKKRSLDPKDTLANELRRLDRRVINAK